MTKLWWNVLAILAIASVGPVFIGSASTLRAQESGSLKANLDLPFEAAGNKEEEEEAPDIVVFYGQQFEGDGIFYCCDMSGSMKEAGKFNHLKQEVTKNISSFSERVQFGVVFFDANMKKFPNTGRPADANATQKSAALAFVSSTTPGSGTCAKPALSACFTYASQSSAKRKIIIYLSDGFHTCPSHDPAQYGKEVLSEASAKNTTHAKINAICIGPSGASNVDEDWMRRLASQNNGQYTRITQ